MRPLSASDALRIWEDGLLQHPLDRALMILAIACPEMTRDELTAMHVGQRDARLLSLRAETLGSTLHGFAECPRCAEHLEFAMEVAELQAALEPDAEPVTQMWELEADGYVLRFRLPTSEDLAAVAGEIDVAKARHLLVERCVHEANRAGASVASSALPLKIVANVAARMADCDPQAEVVLDLRCPSCGHRWQMLFDIASFFWAELSAIAKRLLREVHILARAYGWREQEILSLSGARRQCYLEMVA